MDAALTVCAASMASTQYKEKVRCAGSQTGTLMTLVPQDATTTLVSFLPPPHPLEAPQILMALLKGALSAKDGVGHGFARELRPGAVSACASPLARAHKGGSSLADTASPSALEETH